MGAEGELTQSGAVAVAGGSEEAVPINVRCSNGSKFFVRSTLGSTVADFKGVLAQNCDVPADQQRLIYKGRILKDDQTVDSYGDISCSADAIERAWQILDQIPGRATGAYSHSQATFDCLLKTYGFLTPDLHHLRIYQIVFLSV